jgi:hypothetical protein
VNELTGNIIWLASYPKSGNTWTRMFLHALMTGSPIESFDKIESSTSISSSRMMIDKYLGLDCIDMYQESVHKLRPEIFKLLSDDFTKPTIIKSHDTPFYGSTRIITGASTNKIILVMRNPFDMVASYANHMNISIEDSVNSLCSTRTRIAKSKRKYTAQIAQHIGSWGSYYMDWKNCFRDQVYVIKYEDLKVDPFLNFKGLVEYLDWDHSDEEIKMAIDHSDFKKLKAVEQKNGFIEAPRHDHNFFRAGKSGNWRNEISEEQAQKLVDRHYSVLLELNYIDIKGNILV